MDGVVISAPDCICMVGEAVWSQNIYRLLGRGQCPGHLVRCVANQSQGRVGVAYGWASGVGMEYEDCYMKG